MELSTPGLHTNCADSAVPEKIIPYGRQWVDEDDIVAVVQALRSDWLTTGPSVDAFERMVADRVGAAYAVAVSSGTAALHAAMFALGIGPGDEVIVPPITFAATANCVVYQGGVPVFADVDSHTLLIDPEQVQKRISSRTKAIIAVDYAGQPCDYDVLRTIADEHSISLIADACHALGAIYKGKPAGSLADLAVFSFHPVKHITTGEGGLTSTDNPLFVSRMRRFRNHGIARGTRERSAEGSWFYEMEDLGYNYRISDFQCALGMSQLGKLAAWLQRRRQIASRYDAAFHGTCIEPLAVREDVSHAYHLYVVRVRGPQSRARTFSRLRDLGIEANVHYVPVHLHPFYQKNLGTRRGLCPIAEEAYEQILSLPMYPKMTDADVDRVIAACHSAME
jgi:perosamine synthetase